MTAIPLSHFRKMNEFINISFNLKNPEKPIIERYEEQTKLHNIMLEPVQPPAKIANSVVVVTGLGGIGKTQFVRQYTLKYRDSFENVVWIDSKNLKLIEDSFRRLAAETLKLSLIRADGKEITFETLIEIVYSKLSRTRTLFVYDNVVNNANMRQLINTQPSPYIIITSPIGKWDSSTVIRLKTWNEDNAIMFVTETLNDKGESETSKKLLVNKFQAFPLVLRQATADLNQIREDQKLTIADYIQSYDPLKMFNSRYFQDNGSCLYTETTFTAWNSTIDTIKRHESVGELAIQILNLIAYFSPHKIQKDFFYYLMYRESGFLRRTINFVTHNLFANGPKSNYVTNVLDAIRLLVNHFLVDVNEHNRSELKVNKLVQQVVMLKLQETNRERITLHYAIMLISKVVEIVAFDQLLHSHVLSMSTSFINFRHLIEEFYTHVSYKIDSRPSRPMGTYFNYFFKKSDLLDLM